MARKSAKMAETGGKSYAWIILAMVRLPLLLPYRLRIAVMARFMAYVFAPLAGYNRRIRANLAYVCPELPEREIRRLQRAVPANTGRMLAEIASGSDFTRRLNDIEMQGPGLPALDSARAAGRPIIGLTGHFGNGEAIRYVLTRRGHEVGVLYRPIDDPDMEQSFNDILTSIATPVFPRGRHGLAQMLRFLRQGNMVALLLDQYVHGGAPLTFFGKTAPTSLSAAEMALKYDALLMPFYSIRRGDSFEVIAEEPIPHSDPMTMTQAFNDSLEARVRADMDQWLWIHRRWKPERQRNRAAAKILP